MAAGEDQPEPVVLDRAQLGRCGVVVTSWAACCLESRWVSRRIRSMALRVAVVVSQRARVGRNAIDRPPLDGNANASAAASSAISRSPKRLASEATTRPHSSRCARGSPRGRRDVGSTLQERSHLDLPVAGPRPLSGELQRHVEIGRLDDPEAGQVLLGLDERPVGDQGLARPRLSMALRWWAPPSRPRRPSGPWPAACR